MLTGCNMKAQHALINVTEFWVQMIEAFLLI